VDLDAAYHLVWEFEAPASAIIKHTNPCGCAVDETLAASYRRAYAADPISAFGSVLAFNRPLDEETAQEIVKTFVEAIAAPEFTPAALAVLTRKKNLRLVQLSKSSNPSVAACSLKPRTSRNWCGARRRWPPSVSLLRQSGRRSSSAGRW